MLSREEIITIFKDKEVMLEGHFLLTSGKHSDKYMQCAKLFQYADVSERICKQLADQFREEEIDLVAGPAIGGIIMAYEMGRQLGVKNVFAERENGKMTFRRGFDIPEGANVLVTEDVVTTGGSVKEVVELIQKLGGKVVGVGSVVDRSNGKVNFGVPFRSVLSMEVVSFEPDECPLCKEGIPAIKPGSRNTK
ncbi:orotate phosphoribosyltransferase [Christensenellaceae bacterium OttesenSCG-928-K19]|nr:orotate phosphoribosyltransferase [Christensenellaceae bacterium OttesenSCG-928-K19]